MGGLWGGGQALGGRGVTSLMTLISRPIACKARMADSRPEPGPRTRTSTSRTPCDMAWRAASWATCWAANAVLLREPLKPTRPEVDHPGKFPWSPGMLTRVLLNGAITFAAPPRVFFGL